MKLIEISNLLEQNEIDNILLCENLHANLAQELHQMTSATVSTPFERFKNSTTDAFVKKLKAWSLSIMHDLDKGVETDTKGYMKTLKKIVADPRAAAEQIVNRVIAKNLESEKV